MKLSYKKVIYVGFAFLLIQAFWIAYDAIIPLMLVNKFGMNHTVSGVIMALDNILAIFLLPLFGTLSDKSHSRMGKRKPFVLVGTICAAIAFFGLSFVDYAQYKNLGEQAQMPGEYSVTEQSVVAQNYFWEENFEIHNEENSLTGGGNNGLGDKVDLHNYVSQIIYGKPYDGLAEAQKTACRDWYVNIALSSTYIYENDAYTVYAYGEDGTTASKLVFNADGSHTAEAVDIGEVKRVNASNAYSVLVSGARSVYAAKVTTENPATLILFMAVLFVTLLSMALFRSPAVALMPDVVVRQQRSKGNAIINLMGMVGAIVILAAGMIFGTDKVGNQLMSYIGYFGCVSVLMIVSLIIFMVKVKEPEWAAEMLEDQKAIDAKESALENSAVTEERGSFLHVSEVRLRSGREKPAPKAESAPAPKKERLSGSKLASLIFILLSVAFWYMGYNAITSKYSLYSINVLGKPYNLVLIVAQVVAVIAFLPIGFISEKIGRKLMILIGVLLLAGAFGGAYFINRNSEDWVVYVAFVVAGIGWASINVNSFPMVVDLAKDGNIGRYTGYYYTASMAAQILTPTLSGFLMDVAGSMRPLFIYGAVCVAISFVTMLFVRHGDSKPASKKSALEYLEGTD